MPHRFHTSRQQTTTQRGYDAAHRREKERWRPAVEAGREYCRQGLPGNGSSGTCLYPTRTITPGAPWALGHNDARTAWIGPVHARCNQRDAAARGGKAALAKRRTPRAGQPAQPVRRRTLLTPGG